MSENYYKAKNDELNKEQKYSLSKEEENKLSKFLLEKCGFKQIIPTRDSIITQAKEKNLILPDLMGIHKNRIEYFIELKSKNRRLFFNDNGIDLDKAEMYLIVEKEFNKKVLLVFIDDENEWKEKYPNIHSWFKDENCKCTYYGNWIDKLYEETPQNPITITKDKYETKIICFPLNNMKRIDYIFKERQTKLNFKVIE